MASLASQYQKGKTSLDLNEATDDVVSVCSGISWTISKQSAPLSRQITMPTPHHSIFTGRMLFLMPRQQCQSTEGCLMLVVVTITIATCYLQHFVVILATTRIVVNRSIVFVSVHPCIIHGSVAHASLPQNGNWIDSAIFAGRTVVTNMQTLERRDVLRNSPRLALVLHAVMRAKIVFRTKVEQICVQDSLDCSELL